jgi:hypothetical protein
VVVVEVVGVDCLIDVCIDVVDRLIEVGFSRLLSGTVIASLSQADDELCLLARDGQACCAEQILQFSDGQIIVVHSYPSS